MDLRLPTSQWLLAQGPLKDGTAVCYRQDLEKIARFFRGGVLTPAKVRRFSERLAENYSTQTCRRVLTTFRRLCDWMVAEGILAESPFRGVTIPPDTHRDRRPVRYTMDEVDAIVGTDLASLRNRTILRVLVDTGCAVTHLAHVTDDDLSLADGTMRIGGAVHQLTDATLTELAEYLMIRDQMIELAGIDYDGRIRALWVSLTAGTLGGKMTASGFRGLVKRLRSSKIPANRHLTQTI